MADFERNTTVSVGADQAFTVLSDPGHLADFVPMVTHVGSIAVDGAPSSGEEAGLEADAEAGREAAAEARFVADPAGRRVEWGFPGTGYEGSIVVADGMLASMSKVTIRLHVGDDADPAAIERLLDEAVRNIQRSVARR